ncbi:hypothetical protein [Spiribacter vilamensis]|uniref:Uncharacterized protein n=1 Tax=Spiribacter vilamensis TaxID=531306 RepID=A0A4Q8D0D0_9GAMM|nr:hypothetical protein [Spiribacter vilamensis]RZU98781.1 hypothetical protein EV698_1043 [Spiribacter vilamensis]TVO62198.1 hypothetical protein FPL09_08995 [Spiribacter vilamensis]
MQPTKKNPDALAGADGAESFSYPVNQHTPTGKGSPALVSVFTSRDRLSKLYTLDDSGNLDKTPGGELVRGHYERRPCARPSDLAELIPTLDTNQALAYGVAKVESGPVASRKAARDGDLLRIRDRFDWKAGPGWMMLDNDPPKGAEPLDRAGLLAMIEQVWPEITAAPAVVGDSGTSHIYRTDTGEQVKGRGGLRLYVLVADARDIKRAGDTLHRRLWLAGYGYFAVSASGALLNRSPVDKEVWQPERLDFAAGAACCEPLEQYRPAPDARNDNAAPISTTVTLPDLSSDERRTLKEIEAEAAQAVKPEQREAYDQWVKDRMANMPDDDGGEALQRLVEAVQNHRLYGDFELIHSSGETITVADVMDAPDKWHGERFADPLEPQYGNDARIAWLNLKSGGRPFIYSHAHGGQRFTLVRSSATIKTQPGEMPRILREADALVTDAGEVYQRGGQLVRIVPGGGIYGVQAPWLRTHLEEVAAWQRYDARAKGWRPCDAPGDLSVRMLANRGGWGMPELVGIINGPILRADGSLLDKPGYDAETGLLLDASTPDDWPAIPSHPTEEQIRAAAEVVWEPFAHFPYVDAMSRGVQMAAILTAVQRPILETAPGFGMNAYKAGTGKSKAAKATAWFGGSEPVESPWSDQAEEQRKRIMAGLMAGPASMMFDNISEPIKSDALNAALTASWFKDRKLGVSEEIYAPTRTLMLATGNNLRVAGDLSRRVLVATMDHGVESPETLQFPFDPVARVRDRWLQYRAAALTILRGFMAAGAPRRAAGEMGSFERWDALIRQCVVWMNDEFLAPVTLDDPLDAVRANYDADPETQKLRALIATWHDIHGTDAVRAATLIDEAKRAMFGDEQAVMLDETLQEIAGERGVINPRRLGRWIEGRVGRVIDGYRIEQDGTYRRAKQWRVVPLNPEPPF